MKMNGPIETFLRGACEPRLVDLMSGLPVSTTSHIFECFTFVFRSVLAHISTLVLPSGASSRSPLVAPCAKIPAWRVRGGESGEILWSVRDLGWGPLSYDSDVEIDNARMIRIHLVVSHESRLILYAEWQIIVTSLVKMAAWA